MWNNRSGDRFTIGRTPRLSCSFLDLSWGGAVRVSVTFGSLTPSPDPPDPLILISPFPERPFSLGADPLRADEPAAGISDPLSPFRLANSLLCLSAPQGFFYLFFFFFSVSRTFWSTSCGVLFPLFPVLAVSRFVENMSCCEFTKKELGSSTFVSAFETTSSIFCIIMWFLRADVFVLVVGW